MLLQAPTQPAILAPTVGVLELLLTRSRAPVIAIGGASGKSTTARLVAQMLNASGYGVVLGLGNALGCLDTLTADDRVVIDLVTSVAVAPHAGPAVLAVTGLAHDELPPDQSPAEVAAALLPTVGAATEAVVLNADDQRVKAMAGHAQSRVLYASSTDAGADASLVDGAVVVREPTDGNPVGLCHTDQLSLSGAALLTDLLLAGATAIAAGASPSDLTSVVRQAMPESDCLELVAARGGVSYVSDAKATRPGRTAAALEAQPAPVLLISGGRYGGQPLRGWARAATAKATHVLLYGQADDALARALEEQDCPATIVRCADLDDAVLVAARLTTPGDTVLFSPACEPESPLRPSPGERFRDIATMPRAAQQEAA